MKTTRSLVLVTVVITSAMYLTTSLALGASVEETNTCNTTADDPCERTGTCSIQGADWFQAVTVDRAGIFDTQGWPGVCDMVHVALVQGDCEPSGAQINVTAYLSATTFAEIPSIDGPLACAGEPSAAVGAVPNGKEVSGTPLSLRKGSGDDLVLEWSASCLATDSDYVVYEGLLGNFTSHSPVTCDTSGATTWTLTPAANSSYYIVTPTDGVSEGSHGRDGSGAERLQGLATCYPMNTGGCS
jgi:hypothetical protein